MKKAVNLRYGLFASFTSYARGIQLANVAKEDLSSGHRIGFE